MPTTDPSQPAQPAQPDQPAGASVLRPLLPADHDDVLALNLAFEHVLSPMDADRLTWLVARADRAQVIVGRDGSFAGFVLCFAGDADYDGTWFGRFRDRLGAGFYYLDRVVLAPHAQRQGLARAAYDEIEAGAVHHGTMALEVNVDPPNEPSLAFHRGRGYADLERAGEPGHGVVLMTKRLGPR